MTRATVEDRKAGLGQTLCAGGLSLRAPWRLKDVHEFSGALAARSNSFSGHEKAPMQAWVSCSGCRTPAFDPHALGGAQCGEQRGLAFSTVKP